jgi:hypothetical protein
VLSKDSTFYYNESFHEDEADDVAGPYYYYLGKGKYTVNGGQLLLHFESKFRKIGEIKVDSLSQNELINFENKDKFLKQRLENSFLITFGIYFNNYPFGNLGPEAGIGTIRVNEEPITHLRNNAVAYRVSKFPLTLTFDFGKFTMQQTGSSDIERYWAYQPGEMYQLLDFNFGFLDETIRIEKPGNYKINIYPFKMHQLSREEQVFTGQRALPVKRFLGGIKVGEMDKVKSLLKSKLE